MSNLIIWQLVCSNIPKVKDFPLFGKNIVIAHFCTKKKTFCFASPDFNHGNFFMKLTGSVVKKVSEKFEISSKSSHLWPENQFLAKLKKIQIIFEFSFFFNL